MTLILEDALLIRSGTIRYVLLTATGSTFLSMYHGLVTGKLRSRAKTPYPNAYCTREEITSDNDKYLCT